MPGGMFCISPLTREMTWLAATSPDRPGAEVDLDDADAQQGARLDVFEVVAAGQGAFEDGGDGLLHVRGGHAAVGGEDDDDGHLELGQDVGRRAQVAERCPGRSTRSMPTQTV